MRRRSFVAGIASVALFAIVPAASGQVAGGGALPDFDSRDASKPSEATAKARQRLGKALGAQGFVDDGGPLAGTGFVGRADGFLTARSNASPGDVALAYVTENRAAFGLDRDDIDAFDLDYSYTSWDGVTHLEFAQRTGGLPSFGSSLRANVTEAGRLINVSGSPVSDLRLGTIRPKLGAAEAMAAAREDIGGSKAAPKVKARPGGPEQAVTFAGLESASLVAFPTADGAELAWRVYAESKDALLYEVVVDAHSGDILARNSRTDFLNDADVWDLNPDQASPPTRVNLGADPTWIDRTEGGAKLQGNNAHAYSDIGGVNGADPSEEVAQVGGDWIFPATFFGHAGCPAFGCTWDSANAATKATNRTQATTQMFYLTNKFHDHLLLPPIGFEEASRNFEHVNSSGMGVGGDAVNAESNDSSGTNNANFSTPPDGGAPRMQMFFWNLNYDVNSSDSADVIYHEYAHGLSNRLLGNGGGLGAFQSGSMGEAWSDWYALDYLADTGEITDGPGKDVAVGQYVLGDTGLFGQPGIRRQPTDCDVADTAPDCPGAGTAGPGGFTFGDLGKVGTSVHDNGEIWAETLWDLREVIGVEDARAVITGGLRLAPIAPTFLQMRDAILQEALVLGIPRGPIWNVFAARGMGFSASTPNSSSMIAVEAFDVPGVKHVSTEITDPPPLGDGDGIIEPGETARVSETLQNFGDDSVSGVEGTMSSTTAGVLVGGSASDWADFAPAPSPAQQNDPPFTASVPNDTACGATVSLSIDVASSAGPIAVPAIEVPVGERQFTSATPNLAIPDNIPAGVNSTINLPPGAITDMDVSIEQLTHTWVGDLRLALTSPAATTVVLMNRPGAGTFGSSADNFTDVILDDEASSPIEGIASTPSPITGSFTPDEALSAFDGEEGGGIWTLNVSDNAGGDSGTLNTWGLGGAFECATSVTLPSAATTPATDIETTSAILSGDIDANGAQTDYRFEWGETAAYGESTAVEDAGSGADPATVTESLTGLDLATSYHYRVVALRDGSVIATGADQEFTTLDDTTPPETTIDSGPANGSTIASDSPSFGFSANEPGSTFECKLDAGAFAPCTSPEDLSGLTDGAHTFSVRATDGAGNTDPTPASRTFTVDTTPPETTIDSGPANGSTIASDSPSFGFSANEPGSTFECKLDAGAFASCTSPEDLSGLTDGAHTFSVRATDGVGNADASPASRAFSTDTTGPVTTIKKIKPKRKKKSAKVTFSALDAVSNPTELTFTCQLDKKTPVACSSKHTFKRVKKGKHKVTVIATDALGNEGAPAKKKFKQKKKKKK